MKKKRQAPKKSSLPNIEENNSEESEPSYSDVYSSSDSGIAGN
jgi:hypothetical protein